MSLFEAQPDGRIVALDSALALPDGAYTTLRTYHGRRVLRLEQHRARLVASAALQGAAAELDFERLRRALAAGLAQAGFAEARARITFAPPRLFLSLAPFEPLPEALYERGAECATVPLRRRNPHAKDTRFLAAAESARTHLPAHVHEGLMVDADDHAVLEGLSSNFFAVLQGELRTEAERVLPGVTRAIVLELAAALGPVRLEPVRRAELARASEAFLTSVSRGVLPIARIDGEPVGDGRPGALARALRHAMDELIEREARDVEAG